MSLLVDRIAGLEYGLKKPETLVVCVPVLAQLVQHIQLSRILKPTNFNEMLVYAEKVDPINTYHAIGALIRAVAWIALSVFTGNPWIAFCSFPALYQAYRSSQNLTHSYSQELPRDNRLQVAQPRRRNATAPAAQAGWLSRIGTVLSKSFARTEINPKWVNATMDQAMAEIKTALLRQIDYPNKTLIAVRIEGKGIEPFVGAMNLNFTEAPKTLAWHATLQQRMQEYLAKNQITKFEIALAIGTSIEEGLYKVDVMEKALALKEEGISAQFKCASHGRLNVAAIRHLPQIHPALLPVLNHVEDIFGNNAIPNVW